ncbi:hypothetical protein [Cellulomonas sp. JZ18]|uniref:hypothetical protein n=1 Tax=Cellulomonas sp. JZ18 TaxID=2654191 RepID=UPI0018AF7726|nr:hypothetical protein [Cellulomonas sp. JZ18]
MESMTMTGIAVAQQTYVRSLAPTTETFRGGRVPTAGTPARRRRTATSGIDLHRRTP